MVSTHFLLLHEGDVIKAKGCSALPGFKVSQQLSPFSRVDNVLLGSLDSRFPGGLEKPGADMAQATRRPHTVEACAPPSADSRAQRRSLPVTQRSRETCECQQRGQRPTIALDEPSESIAGLQLLEDTWGYVGVPSRDHEIGLGNASLQVNVTQLVSARCC